MYLHHHHKYSDYDHDFCYDQYYNNYYDYGYDYDYDYDAKVDTGGADGKVEEKAGDQRRSPIDPQGVGSLLAAAFCVPDLPNALWKRPRGGIREQG